MDGFALMLFNVIVSYSKYSRPPRLSGQGFTVVSCVGIKPVEVVIFMAIGATLMVLMSSTRDPRGTSWFLAVAAVLIGVADVVTIFGAIMGHLKPFVSLAILLHDLLID